MSCYRSVSDIFSISLSTFFSLLVLFIEGVIVARALDCSANLYLTLLLSPFSLSPGSHILSFSLSHVDTHPCTLRRTHTHAHTHSHSNTSTHTVRFFFLTMALIELPFPVFSLSVFKWTLFVFDIYCSNSQPSMNVLQHGRITVELIK